MKSLLVPSPVTSLLQAAKSSQAQGELTARHHLGHDRGGGDKVLLRGLEGDEDGFGVAGVEGVDGAGERVEIDRLHGEVDAGHEACQLTRRQLPALAQQGELVEVCNIVGTEQSWRSVSS